MCSPKYLSFLVAAISVALYALHKPLPQCLHTMPYKAWLAFYTKGITDRLTPTLEHFGIATQLDLMRAHSSYFMSGVADTDSVQSFETYFDTVRVRVYRPVRRAPNGTALFYIHGGGWVLDSIDTYDELVRTIAERLNVLTVSVEYRLAPEYRYPAAINDVERAFLYFSKHSSDFEIDPLRIIVAGDSAGGNLAAALAGRLRSRTSRPFGQLDKGDPRIKLQVLLYPTLQAVNFSTVSMQLNKDDPLLSRTEMMRFVLQYALGMDYHYNATLRGLAERYIEQGCYRLKARSKVQDVFFTRGADKEDIRERIMSDMDRTFLKSLQDTSTTHRKLFDTSCSIKSDADLSEIYERLECLLDPEFSPLLSRSVEHLPPAYIVSCGNDVLRDDALLYAERLRDAAIMVEHKHYPNDCHGFLVYDPSSFIEELRVFLIQNALL